MFGPAPFARGADGKAVCRLVPALAVDTALPVADDGPLTHAHRKFEGAALEDNDDC